MFKFLKPQFVPKKYWSNGASWKMAKHIDHEVRKTTKVDVQNAKFIFLTCDGITSMDNASWASVHGYVVQDWC